MIDYHLKRNSSMLLVLYFLININHLKIELFHQFFIYRIFKYSLKVKCNSDIHTYVTNRSTLNLDIGQHLMEYIRVHESYRRTPSHLQPQATWPHRRSSPLGGDVCLWGQTLSTIMVDQAPVCQAPVIFSRQHSDNSEVLLTCIKINSTYLSHINVGKLACVRNIIR